MTDRVASFVASILLHTTAFAGVEAALTRPVEYGIEVSYGGIEVDLVAAPLSQEDAAEDQVIAVQEDFVASAEQVVSQPAQPISTALHGDGSSIVLGQDATTLQSADGAWTEAKPSYLKNPAPRYPAEARRLGQEGLVVLWVVVNEKGLPREVVVRQSSGFNLLDEAALKAVTRWKFQAARVGPLNVESKVEVPIRFQLEDNR